MEKPDLKNYEVLLVAYTTVLVIDAESEEEAYELARDEVWSGSWDIDEMKIERVVPDKDLDQARRHASHIAEA